MNAIIINLLTQEIALEYRTNESESRDSDKSLNSFILKDVFSSCYLKQK